MNKEIMTDYYRNNPKDILNEQLADDKPYHALIQKKIAAENAFALPYQRRSMETLSQSGFCLQ